MIHSDKVMMISNNYNKSRENNLNVDGFIQENEEKKSVKIRI